MKIKYKHMNTILPTYKKDNSETGCCSRFDPEPWDEKEFELQNKLFAKATTINFMHIPLNMGKKIVRMMEKIKTSKAEVDDYLFLAYDPSPWKSELYFSVSKELPETEMVRLSGHYLTKVFEGPFKDAGKWVKEMEQYIESKNQHVKKMYLSYTSCPSCAKHYGKNYVVAFAQIS